MNNDDDFGNLGEETLKKLRKDTTHSEALAMNEAIDHLEAAYKLMKAMPTKGRPTYLLGRALRLMLGDV